MTSSRTSHDISQHRFQMLAAMRFYPHTQPVIADLIRPFIGTRTIRWHTFRLKAENLVEIHRRLVNPEGQMGNATLSTCWIRPWRKLVLALRQYPQGGPVILGLIQNPQGRDKGKA